MTTEPDYKAMLQELLLEIEIYYQLRAKAEARLYQWFVSKEHEEHDVKWQPLLDEAWKKAGDAVTCKLCGHPQAEHGQERDFVPDCDSKRELCLVCPGYDRPYGKAWHRFRKETP